MDIKYNTQQAPILLKKYGRNIQNLVNYICKEPDKKKRTQLINELKDLTERLIATPNESIENTQQVWDNLHIISNFNLDVDSPYPAPKRETLLKKPEKVEYPQNNVRSRYGKNIDKLLKGILDKKDPKERRNGAIYLGRLLNTFHSSWSKSAIDNAIIIKNIEQMSDKKLSIDLDSVEKDNLFEKLYREKRKVRSQAGQQNQRKEKKPYAKRHTGTYRKRTS